MDFLNIKRIYQKNKKLIDKYVNHVLSSGQYIEGEYVKELEKELSVISRGTCITCACGTDALLLAIMGTGLAGKRVAVPAFGMRACVEMVKMTGGTPVYVDIATHSYNMDPELIPSDVDGVIAMELFGSNCHCDWIREVIGDKPLIVDAAQNFGYGIWRQLKAADVVTTSFGPPKILGCFGDGGAVFVNEDRCRTDYIRSFKNHGRSMSDKSRHVLPAGFNSRLDELQAAILCARLDTLDTEIENRHRIAGDMSAWGPYAICLDSDDRLGKLAYLKEKGIPTKVFYPEPLAPLPNALYLSERIFQLPNDPYMTDEEIKLLKEAFYDITDREREVGAKPPADNDTA